MLYLDMEEKELKRIIREYDRKVKENNKEFMKAFDDVMRGF